MYRALTVAFRYYHHDHSVTYDFFGRIYFLWGQAGRRAKGSLQRAATARTADRKTGQNVRRHDLHRSNASMNKQKKNSVTYVWCAIVSLVWIPFALTLCVCKTRTASGWRMP